MADYKDKTADIVACGGMRKFSVAPMMDRIATWGLFHKNGQLGDA